MKVFIVYCHPEPKSFNHAMFAVAQETLEAHGHEVRTSDIYALDFNPKSGRENFTSVADPDFLKISAEETLATDSGGFAPELEAEIQKMEWCDLMIWQFPLWWFGLPGGLKGWVDKVFAYHRIYGFGHMFDQGKMSGKKVMLSFTTGVPQEGYRSGGLAGDVLQIVKPVHYGVLQFVGFDVLQPHVVFAPIQKTDEERRWELDRYRDRLSNIFSENPIEVERY
jgi:NAD(P)H dehydrogenase (quinone)